MDEQRFTQLVQAAHRRLSEYDRHEETHVTDTGTLASFVLSIVRNAGGHEDKIIAAAERALLDLIVPPTRRP